MKSILRRQDLIEPELSYKILGILFHVYNIIGPGHPEKVYQRAISQSLQEAKMLFQEQVLVPLIFENKSVGRYFLDFLIDDKVVLEIKSGERFSPKNIAQVNSYLKATKFQLAVLANFTRDGVVSKRLVNTLKSY